MKEIEIITKGANLHEDYTVIRFKGQTPKFILDKDKSIYNSLFSVDGKKVIAILDKCNLVEKPNIKQPERKLNPKKDEVKKSN